MPGLIEEWQRLIFPPAGTPLQGGEQLSKGNQYADAAKINLEYHLAAKKTYAVDLAWHDPEFSILLTRAGVLDIDESAASLDKAEDLARLAKAEGLTAALAWSGGRGCHVWIFSEPVRVNVMVAALKRFKEAVPFDGEYAPGDRVRIKLTPGWHREAKAWSFFFPLGELPKPINKKKPAQDFLDGQAEFLAALSPTPADQLFHFANADRRFVHPFLNRAPTPGLTMDASQLKLKPTRAAVFLILVILAALAAACAGPQKPVIMEPPAAPVQPAQPAQPRAAVDLSSIYVVDSATKWTPLIHRLALDGFPGQEMADLFAKPDAAFRPQPMRMKLKELFRLQYKAELTREIQKGLLELGYTPGDADGMAGPNTRRAIAAFQKAHRLNPDGQSSEALLWAVKHDLRLPPSRRPKPVVTMTEEPVSRTYLKGGYLQPRQLDENQAFFQKNKTLLLAMEARYGVPAEIAVGIMRVETNLGTYLGTESAFNNLASMALAGDYRIMEPYMTDQAYNSDENRWLAQTARQRGDWAYAELKALIQYARANRQDPLAIPGSIYGAIGMCQFMPTNALKFGVDGNGDGRVDLFNVADAVFSIGAYFKGHGWQGKLKGDEAQRQVVYKYNLSTPYVNTVLAVASKVKR